MKVLSNLLVLSFFSLGVLAQGSDEYSGGLKVTLNEDGSKYFRLIQWNQIWLQSSQNSEGNTEFNTSLRRSRVLMYSQISDRFLVLAHFGLNSLNAGGMDPVGKSPSAAIFMHDAWSEYKVVDKYLSIGGGLHYWNGISRLTNQSTLNIMTLDAPRFNWATIGTSDQFARHMGVYAKGKIGNFDYRLALNNPTINSLDAQRNVALGNDASYQTLALQNSGALNSNLGKYAYQGYFKYEFLDNESNFLPYAVGSYLGTKKVFNIGAGFFSHPDGTVSQSDGGDFTTHNVNLWAVDVFYDSPLGSKGASINFYGVYYNFDFGPNYKLLGTSDLIATGNIAYVQTGYTLPEFTDKGKLQPYIATSIRNMEAFDNAANTIGLGANWFISGHNAKLSAEYNINNSATGVNTNRFTLQAMIYI
ncbi:MAG: porin [Bacteroidia bacterium]